jgi:hypothetical protein
MVLLQRDLRTTESNELLSSIHTICSLVLTIDERRSLHSQLKPNHLNTTSRSDFKPDMDGPIPAHFNRPLTPLNGMDSQTISRDEDPDRAISEELIQKKSSTQYICQPIYTQAPLLNTQEYNPNRCTTSTLALAFFSS